jgi:hypothetical protein
MDWLYARHQPAEHSHFFIVSYYSCIQAAQEVGFTNSTIDFAAFAEAFPPCVSNSFKSR